MKEKRDGEEKTIGNKELACGKRTDRGPDVVYADRDAEVEKDDNDTVSAVS